MEPWSRTLHAERPRDQGEVRRVLQPAPARARDGRRVEPPGEAPRATRSPPAFGSWLGFFLLEDGTGGGGAILALSDVLYLQLDTERCSGAVILIMA